MDEFDCTVHTESRGQFSILGLMEGIADRISSKEVALVSFAWAGCTILGDDSGVHHGIPKGLPDGNVG